MIPNKILDLPYNVKEFCRNNWKTVLWLILASFAMTTLWVPPWDRPVDIYVRVSSFMCFLWIFLWVGNGYTSNLVSRWVSWTERPMLRFVLGMLTMVVYTGFVVYLLVELAWHVFKFRIGLDELLWSSLGITFVISLFMHGRAFLNNWRQAEMNSIELQKESMRSQYDSLKNQVNPHFLFNSLNALTNLIYDDQDKAAKFVKQLSEVYRYVLETQNKEVVPLADELKFLNSYLFLQQIRFGDKLKLEIHVNPSNTQVAPLVLQMLVENAIKHNIISNDQPLTIRMYNEGDRIVVENNLQKKTVMPEESKGIGLQNIRKRYSFLTNTEVIVNHTQSAFVVKIPLITA